jgi:hypothetical protein
MCVGSLDRGIGRAVFLLKKGIDRLHQHIIHGRGSGQHFREILCLHRKRAEDSRLYITNKREKKDHTRAESAIKARRTERKTRFKFEKTKTYSKDERTSYRQ